MLYKLESKTSFKNETGRQVGLKNKERKSMARIFGADSAQPANTRLTNGYDLFSWVMRQNCFPAFWGRSVSGENAITKEELEFLRSKNLKIALIFDDLTETNVSAANGTDDALRAVSAAKELGVPANEGIALFAKIAPDWSINHNWMISFARIVKNNGFVPGFIGNTDSSVNFNFDRQCSHFVQATNDVEHYGTLYWATEPKTGGEPEDWAPYCPTALTPEKIDLWQNGTTSCGQVTANTSYARDESILKYLW
jgi:hypothetical protein